jgi:hydrogenase maturation factor
MSVVARLRDEGIPASIVGEAVPPEEKIHIFENGKKHLLAHPKTDPFWGKFEEYLKKRKEK